MKIKQGVSLIGLKLEMRKALLAADHIWAKHGQELVVTSGTDGEHSAGSLHYYGYALDFRTHYFTDRQKKLVTQELVDTLTTYGFRVIKHKTHIHIEYRRILSGWN